MAVSASQATVATLTAGAGLALVLPGVDAAHEADPADAGFRRVLSHGTAVYALLLAVIGGLEAKLSGSVWPLVAAGGMMLVLPGLLEQHRRRD